MAPLRCHHAKMKKLLSLLRLDILPASADLGLLVLRVWLGASLFLLHGKGKLLNFSQVAQKFADPLGVGVTNSLAMAVFAEVLCAILLVLGLFTRAAAVALIVTMVVAFAVVHKSVLTGPASGELAFIYLAGFVAIFIAGPGRFSLDAMMRGKGVGR